MFGMLGLGLWMLCAPPSPAQAAPRVPAVEQWSDVSGGNVNPFRQDERKATVLLFVMTDCPIANSYAPEINRITAEYGAKHITFYIVYVDPHLKATAAQQHAHDYGYRCTALLDPQHTLAHRAGATVSPEAVVVGPDLKFVYRGRIDDRVIDFGQIRHQPTRSDLRLTLDAVLRGAAAPNAKTPCIGCFIASGVEKH
jgi:hypothetical protein